MINIKGELFMHNLLPKDKFDYTSIANIKKLKRSEVIPLLPGLWEWVQDMNWPIAPGIAGILLEYPNEIVPLIKSVFNTDDCGWKYWCLLKLLPKLLKEHLHLLKHELQRLVESPTKNEKLEELDILAADILNGL